MPSKHSNTESPAAGEKNGGREAVTHAEFVQRAERWLRGSARCGVVLTERACGGTGEIPDAIGWKKSFWSVLVECKVSRSDFLRDRKKHFRAADSNAGMGQERWFMAPVGLLLPEEIPEGWGLVEVVRDRCRIVKRASSDRFMAWRCRPELALLYAFARRAQLGLEPTVGCLVKAARRANRGGSPETICPGAERSGTGPSQATGRGPSRKAKHRD